MEISSYEAWEEGEKQDQQRGAVIHPNYVQKNADHRQALESQWAELLAQLTCTVVATGIMPNMIMPAAGAGRTLALKMDPVTRGTVNTLPVPWYWRPSILSEEPGRIRPESIYLGNGRGIPILVTIDTRAMEFPLA